LCFEKLGTDITVKFLDDMKELGFQNATRGGITVSVDDMLVPIAKPEILRRSYKEVADIEAQYRKGIITAGERYNKVIDIWTHTTDQIADVMFSGLQADRRGSTRSSSWRTPEPAVRRCRSGSWLGCAV